MKNKENQTKGKINAEKILKRIHIHDLDHGGVFVSITGAQGSGKTSVMLSFMKYTITHYPNEKIFFSNPYNAPLQFVKIGKEHYHIMTKEGAGVTFHDRTQRLKQIYPNVTMFKDYNDLYEKALPGYCNAVFFGDRYEWMGFVHYLRSVGEWTHLYFDELSEIAPAFTGGGIWKQIKDFAIDLKEIRKCQINVFSNTQSLQDLDHRVRTKTMIRLYMPGARSGGESRVNQPAIDNLEENPKLGNQGYVEMSGKFGRTRFKDIFKPNQKQLWEARVNGE